LCELRYRASPPEAGGVGAARFMVGASDFGPVAGGVGVLRWPVVVAGGLEVWVAV
jgi:hypothetical protein